MDEQRSPGADDDVVGTQSASILEASAPSGDVGPAGIGGQARPALDREEREIQDNVLRMGSLVESQILAAIDALTSHDPDKALAVIVGDSRINEAQRHVSTLIAKTIATQQPVARDLRFLLSLDHVTYELERIGDELQRLRQLCGELLEPFLPLEH